MHPILRAIVAASIVGVPTISAAGIYTAPCGPPVDFDGDMTAVIFCLVGNGGESNSAGVARAGRNFFKNNISPVRDNNTKDGVTTNFFHQVDSFPTWDAGVTKVPSHLGLDGEVKLFTSDAS